MNVKLQIIGNFNLIGKQLANWNLSDRYFYTAYFIVTRFSQIYANLHILYIYLYIKSTSIYVGAYKWQGNIDLLF